VQARRARDRDALAGDARSMHGDGHSARHAGVASIWCWRYAVSASACCERSEPPLTVRPRPSLRVCGSLLGVVTQVGSCAALEPSRADPRAGSLAAHGGIHHRLLAAAVPGVVVRGRHSHPRWAGASIARSHRRRHRRRRHKPHRGLRRTLSWPNWPGTTCGGSRQGALAATTRARPTLMRSGRLWPLTTYEVLKKYLQAQGIMRVMIVIGLVVNALHALLCYLIIIKAGMGFRVSAHPRAGARPVRDLWLPGNVALRNTQPHVSLLRGAAPGVRRIHVTPSPALRGRRSPTSRPCGCCLLSACSARASWATTSRRGRVRPSRPLGSDLTQSLGQGCTGASLSVAGSRWARSPWR
jgi:hypothetical protein